MHRLHCVLALAVLASLLSAVREADAQQQRQQAQPSQRQVIIRDRWQRGPPPPPSSDRNYYGPAPGIQQPMERVPMPAPLSQPPTNR